MSVGLRLRAVVLAAGEGRRMGRPKALLEVGGRTLVEAHVAALRMIASTTVVVRPETMASLPPLDARVVAHATTSQAESLARALEGDDADVFVVTPVDLLPAAPETLHRLLEALAPGVDAVTPEHAGRGGHPVVVRAEVLAPYRTGSMVPLRQRIAEVRRTKVVVADPNVLGDLDVVADLVRLAT